MKNFKTAEEATEYGMDNLGKHECELVVVDGKKTLLCSTNLVYEDELWNGARELFRFLHISAFKEDIDDCDGYIDEASEIRDEILSMFLKSNNLELIEACTEF